ncbi:predicted protein [Thalassiosira pseudonana CCMP1335]|uniref:Uncharacterized protein n=1 Tax=Thalassiosira pseudonana TaxID=35128 RepID=B8BVV8_THAPS|nr:predicted protein [Thalassiosira pseudonana CCMP1335]EED95007.1 predicted protein [Thalassiosira pseudonana CCMP1335]|eukprot:scaffold1627_cov164-Alexandrium_tamarense.AAC.14
MASWLLSALLLLSATLQLTSAEVLGKGPLGIHPINDRYIAVADSSIDAVLIVDGSAGGAVVGHYVLHDRKNDPTDADSHIGSGVRMSSWVDPISIATCDTCKHIFLTSPGKFYKVALDRPLLEMANAKDFSGFTSKSTISEYWPSNWSEKYYDDGYLRMVSVAPDGSSGYVAHSKAGVFSFDPLDPSEGSSKAQHVIHVGDAGIDEQEINGLHHTHSLKNLILTSSKYVHFVKLQDSYGDNPLDNKDVTAYRLPLDYHCDYLYGGTEMTFTDTVVINDYAFVIGHPIEQGVHNGIAIYRLTWYEEDETWHDCVQVAGSGLEEAAWVDGTGREARFSMTPHDIAVLPSMNSHTIVVADADNRALRYVDVTLPVENDDDGVDPDSVRVSSVAYNEDLFMVLYKKDEPWVSLTPEAVMKSDGKSYYHSGRESIYKMTYGDASDECSRVGIGRICTLPEIRARFERGQYPTLDGDDNTWTTVWTNEMCSSCHLQGPGACSVDGKGTWGTDYKMIANFSPRRGMQMQCTKASTKVDSMSMCCGMGGPGVMNAQGSTMSAAAKGGISAAVILPILLIALAFGLYMRRRAKPVWWPKIFRKDRREDTGHAPHREVDLRGRDYI